MTALASVPFDLPDTDTVAVSASALTRTYGEGGSAVNALRGVSIEGTGEISEDPDLIWKVGVNVWERYNGPYTEEVRPLVELHRDEIDAGIDHLIPAGRSSVRMESFTFDRAALDELILDLWTFVRERSGMIVRPDPAGDMHIKLDFSHIVDPAYLDAEAARIRST